MNYLYLRFWLWEHLGCWISFQLICCWSLLSRLISSHLFSICSGSCWIDPPLDRSRLNCFCHSSRRCRCYCLMLALALRPPGLRHCFRFDSWPGEDANSGSPTLRTASTNYCSAECHSQPNYPSRSHLPHANQKALSTTTHNSQA